MKRWPQLLLIVTFLAWCWLAMQAVHELGHVLAAWATGGTVTKVVLHPLAISRTDVSPNLQPLIVVWGGPMIGVAAPLLIWAAMKVRKMPGWQLAQFFAGFCLLANGLYVGVGSFDGVGDPGDMLRLGSPLSLLWLFGLLTIPTGFGLWHGLGEAFGLGKANGHVDVRTAYVSAAMLAITIAAEVSLNPRA